MNLHQPLHVLPGVGPKSAEKYAKLGIENLQDLLLYFPFRYEDFKTKQVLELEDGEKAVLSGQVVTPASVQYYGFKRNRLRFSLKQGEVVFAVNFFNQPYLADKIELGATLAVFGKWDRAKASLTGMKVLAQVEDDLQPVYRLAQGISQASLVKVIKTAFDQGLDLLIEENLPQSLLDKYKLMSSCQAVRAMHFPKDLAEYKRHEVGPPHESSFARGCGEWKNGSRWLGYVCGGDSWLSGCPNGTNRNPRRATF